MSEKLKPCPFCGKMDTVGVFARSQIEELEDWDDADCFAVCCDATTGGCGAVGGYTSTKGASIKLWNRRAPLYTPVKPDDVTDGYYWAVLCGGHLMAMVQEETGADFSEIMKAYEKDARETGATPCT